MKKILHIYLITQIGLLLSHCEKTITINHLPFESQLSVECILEPNQIPKLYLGNTAAYFDTISTNLEYFVDNATITLSNPLCVDTLNIATEYSYYSCQNEYLYRGNIPIVQGQQYHLKIQHEGNTYKADTEVNLPSISIDSVTFVSSFKDIFGEHEGVVVSLKDLPGEKNYYRYRMDRILSTSNPDIPDCAGGPFSATELGRSIFFDTNIDGAPLKIVIEPAFQHEQGDTARVYIQTLDAATARFFDDLDKQKNAKINPFIEPVFINSNIPGAFGIFGACNYSEAVKFIYPE